MLLRDIMQGWFEILVSLIVPKTLPAPGSKVTVPCISVRTQSLLERVGVGIAVGEVTSAGFGISTAFLGCLMLKITIAIRKMTARMREIHDFTRTIYTLFLFL